MGAGESEGQNSERGIRPAKPSLHQAVEVKPPLTLCCCQHHSSGISSSEIIRQNKVTLSAELNHNLQIHRHHHDSDLLEAQDLSLKGLRFVKYVCV